MKRSRLGIAKKRRALLETRWGSILLSWDLLAAVPAGIAASVAPTVSDAVSSSAPAVLLTATAVSAAILALVLAAVSFIAFVVDQQFLQLIRRTVGGADDLRRTFLAVAAVAAAAIAVTLVVALVWPALGDAPWWLQAPSFSLGSILFLWAVFGAVQLVDLSLFLAGKREEFAAHVEQARQARRRVS
ncbi:hypothetical protein [uncultured Modestobacter sp.]|uniref:hypothetical protein n=1 Tax=uncultured Modestobacter sp. TaxID=380048 RepID=UPI00263251B3|nr:hypothetical protein [uncultured Modestobacter sp.]